MTAQLAAQAALDERLQEMAREQTGAAMRDTLYGTYERSQIAGVADLPKLTGAERGFLDPASTWRPEAEDDDGNG